MSSSNLTGFVLAVISSAFIGSSFIIKKKGLQLARVNGPSASVGGYGYLLQPLWWVGMVTMIVGEIANFIAYIYAPAVLVTPLGALSIIVSAVLAHFLLKEKLLKMGMLGCLICILGSTIIVLHAPQEMSLSSVQQIWKLAIQPAFLMYTASAIAITLFLVLYCAPRYGQTNILVYIGICSIIGSLTALDNFNTAVVSPIYYALFTAFTILASAIMFKDYSGQSIGSVVSELCGFVTILSGTILLHSTREPDPQDNIDLCTPLSPSVSWYIGNNESRKHKEEDVSPFNLIAIIRQDHFK
ncbi:probable magnesium transporter NIPA7 isoform X2 [Trifolium pratense]|uniref:probable magnesium transporter NIPA7 isoform X2 n=1 Tax=Trifolium pratense TaxID=57577 RepID=UPI001E69209C|nr:probable magnesium transporter NIPA7 isoform X2 [Trifolium pratense]